MRFPWLHTRPPVVLSRFAPEVRQSARERLLLSPRAEEGLSFSRQFPHDLPRFLDSLHAIHGLPGPKGHRVELPRRRLVGDKRVARVHGNADVRSPRLRGLADALSVEPLDRFD